MRSIYLIGKSEYISQLHPITSSLGSEGSGMLMAARIWAIVVSDSSVSVIWEIQNVPAVSHLF